MSQENVERYRRLHYAFNARDWDRHRLDRRRTSRRMNVPPVAMEG